MQDLDAGAAALSEFLSTHTSRVQGGRRPVDTWKSQGSSLRRLINGCAGLAAAKSSFLTSRAEASLCRAKALPDGGAKILGTL